MRRGWVGGRNINGYSTVDYLQSGVRVFKNNGALESDGVGGRGIMS